MGERRFIFGEDPPEIKKAAVGAWRPSEGNGAPGGFDSPVCGA
ncbi:hypothetical protein HMPREF3038_01688 [Akkermansia sp. KLE1797]|nr:hypothetical protein HMPREF3038_01688 [Akkermansia sp. KLE1797]KXU53891.1 hypothetical protein HMPREF3039_01846 [Akkermansia sp. KLE1798]KZA03072.1 hypothetical protein HMPREF1326_03116 [Akkermansia sp. KLE1605]